MSEPTSRADETPRAAPARATVPQAAMLSELVYRIQDYTKRWPEQLRYPRNAGIAATDGDQGFERLLRESLVDVLPVGDVSGNRDMGMGDGRVPAIAQRHELDLIVRCFEGRFVIEAKAWQGEVGKEAIIVFIAKILDFLAASSLEPIGPVFAGFIALSGFSEAASRIMFACGLTPFTKRAEQLAFRYLDALLRGAAAESERRNWAELGRSLKEHQAMLTPYVAHEEKGISHTFLFEPESAIVDLEAIRRASDMFDEARVAHEQALNCYRQFKEAASRG